MLYQTFPSTHPENVLSQANTVFSSWYQTAVFHCRCSPFSLVLRQYEVSVSNTTILQSYFYNKKCEDVSK